MKMLEGEAPFWHGLQENREWSDGRMIFADWLDDRDDPRAEGMRVLGEFHRSSTPGETEIVGHAMPKYTGFCTFDFCISYIQFCFREFGPSTSFRGINIVHAATLPEMWLRATQYLIRKHIDWNKGGAEHLDVENFKQFQKQWVAAKTFPWIESQVCLAYGKFSSRNKERIRESLVGICSRTAADLPLPRDLQAEEEL